MNHNGWQEVESILDRYDVKPIVGIIPDSSDPLFCWEEDPRFWTETVQRWIAKGWTIAQHGYHHVYHPCKDGSHSEFSDLSYEEQMFRIKTGYEVMVNKGCQPSCFFAPGHTFDNTTIDVCRDFGRFDFISDGYALYPYQEKGMLFFPSIFDTPHRILPFGVYTFILHPSFTKQSAFSQLDRFISSNRKSFSSATEVLLRCNKMREKSAIEKTIHPTITTLRKIRKMLLIGR